MLIKIDDEELKRLQKKYGFKLCRIKGTNIIQIAKRERKKLEIIEFDEFIQALKDKKLAVYRNENDWLKIMRDR